MHPYSFVAINPSSWWDMPDRFKDDEQLVSRLVDEGEVWLVRKIKINKKVK